MDRKENLKNELNAQFNKLCDNVTDKDRIGSLIFWADDYGAHLFFSKWKINEFPWSIENDNTISIEDFEEDWNVLTSDVEEYFMELNNSETLAKLPLRKGFQFALTFFNESPTAVGEPKDGIAGSEEMTQDMAVKNIENHVKSAFEKAASSPVQKIVITSEEGESVVELYTDKHLAREQSEYNCFSGLDLGIALTEIASSGEDAFFILCSKIINSKYFQDFPKRRIVVFYFVVSSEEYFALVYDPEKNKLRQLDEDTELNLLYENLDD